MAEDLEYSFRANDLLPACVLECIPYLCAPGSPSKPHLSVPVSEPVHLKLYLKNPPNTIWALVYHSGLSLCVSFTQDTLLSFLWNLLSPAITFFTYLFSGAHKPYQNKVYVIFIDIASLAELLFKKKILLLFPTIVTIFFQKIYIVLLLSKWFLIWLI